MLCITAVIEERGLSEEEVASLLRITPPNEISSILDGLRKGQLDKFTPGQLKEWIVRREEIMTIGSDNVFADIEHPCLKRH